MSTLAPFAFSVEESAIKSVAGTSESGLEYSKDFQFAQLENPDETARTFSNMVTAASPNVAEVKATSAVQESAANAPVQATGVVQDEKVPAPADVESIEPQERASKALGLPTAIPKAVTETGGDTILNGMQKLRGVFDTQIDSVNQAVSGPLDNVEQLMRVQTEWLKFSMLVEVSSKLVGKSTQAFETLMKGQ
jgi:type III secretion system YscI/HrpB-like protein